MTTTSKAPATSSIAATYARSRGRHDPAWRTGSPARETASATRRSSTLSGSRGSSAPPSPRRARRSATSRIAPRATGGRHRTPIRRRGRRGVVRRKAATRSTASKVHHGRSSRASGRRRRSRTASAARSPPGSAVRDARAARGRRPAKEQADGTDDTDVEGLHSSLPSSGSAARAGCRSAPAWCARGWSR